MGVAVSVTRLDYSAAELRGLARVEAGAVACRILAIAHVLDGMSRAEAAALCGMDRQTLRDWVHRFNADGIEGLANSTGSGRPPALSEAQMAELIDRLVAADSSRRNAPGKSEALPLCGRSYKSLARLTGYRYTTVSCIIWAPMAIGPTEISVSLPRRVDLQVGSAIRAGRVFADLSADQLARTLKLHPDALVAFELGVERIPASTLFELANVLDRNVSWFFSFQADGMGEEPLASCA